MACFRIRVQNDMGSLANSRHIVKLLPQVVDITRQLVYFSSELTYYKTFILVECYVMFQFMCILHNIQVRSRHAISLHSFVVSAFKVLYYSLKIIKYLLLFRMTQ